MKKAVKKSWPKPKKEKAEKVVEAVVAPQTEAPVEGPVCECGKPVAPGQNYVCADHIRRG